MKKRNNSYGNFYSKNTYVKQEINIYNEGYSPSKNYVPSYKIKQLDQMIEELIIMDTAMFGKSRDEVIRKYRGHIKDNYGDGAYNKLTPENFEQAKKYLQKILPESPFL